MTLQVRPYLFSQAAKSFVFLVLLFTLLLLPSQLFAQGTQQYDITQQCFAVADELASGSTQDTLTRLDRTTGQSFVIGSTGTLNIEGIAFGPDGHLYAADANQLGTLDLATGLFTPLSQPFGVARGSAGTLTLSDVDSLTYDIANNTFYGVHRRSGLRTDLLFAIDLTTGAHIPNFFGAGIDYVEIPVVTDETGTQLGDVDDLAVDPITHVMYAAINDSGLHGVLAIVNPATGNTVSMNTFRYASGQVLAGEIVDDLEGLAFFNDGRLYASSGNFSPDGNDKNSLYRIDTTNAEAELIGPFPSTNRDYEGLDCLTAQTYISIEKATNGPGQTPEDADDPTGPQIQAGDAVTWTYQIVNSGMVTLTDLLLTDNQVGLIGPNGASNCPPAGTILAPGESTTCTATGVAQVGQYANTAIVTGTSQIGVITPRQTVTDSDPSHYFGLNPAIAIKKFTNNQDADDPNGFDVPQIAPGATVTWTYRVTNIGNVPFTDTEVMVSDDIVGPITQIVDKGDGDNILAPGEVWIYQKVGTAVNLLINQSGLTIVEGCDFTESGVTRPAYRNIGTVVVQDLMASDPSHYCNTPAPAIAIKKFTNGQDADDPNGTDVPQIAPGAAVTWTYRVTNTGNITIMDVDISVSDDIAGPVTQIINKGDGDNLLAPGEVWIYQKVGTAVNLLTAQSGVTTVPGCDPNQTDLIRPAYRNIGMVMALEMTDSDPSHYCNAPAPGIVIKKFTNGNDADNANDADVPQIAPGATITWTYYVTNTGNVPFSDSQVAVNDDIAGQVTQIIDKGDGNNVLAPGETWIYQKVGTAVNLTTTQAGLTIVAGCDPNNAGVTRPTYRNIGTVTAQQLTATDPSHYCNVLLASVGNLVFGDIDPTGSTPAEIEAGNGLQDPGEAGINGVIVQLYTAEGVFITETVTTNGGNYLFNNLPPGDYYLVFINPLTEGIWTVANAGSDDAIDSDPNSTVADPRGDAVRTDVFTLEPGENDLTWDAGLIGLSSTGSSELGDRVWLDKNTNGIQDGDEAGFPGAIVKLYTGAGVFVKETTTGVDGIYSFPGLNPGNYMIEFTLPDNYRISPQNATSNDQLDSDADPTSKRTTVITLPAFTVDRSWDAGIYVPTSLDPEDEPTPGTTQIFLPLINN
ncbi:MAG: SdrD B-like domain-containing protein [Caldilineaceae bacterium]